MILHLCWLPLGSTQHIKDRGQFVETVEEPIQRPDLQYWLYALMSTWSNTLSSLLNSTMPVPCSPEVHWTSLSVLRLHPFSSTFIPFLSFHPIFFLPHPSVSLLWVQNASLSIFRCSSSLPLIPLPLSHLLFFLSAVVEGQIRRRAPRFISVAL